MATAQVKVTPKSSRNLVRLVEGEVRVWTTAAPTDGEANAAVCALIADAVGAPKSAVQVIRGHTSRQKTVRVDLFSDQELIAALERLG